MFKQVFKQKFLSCLINERMIPHEKTGFDVFVEKMDYCKETRHSRFCDAMAMRVKQGGFTDDEKETIAEMIDWKFLFLNTKPSEFYEIMQESESNATDNMSKEAFFDELRTYGVDVDALEK